MPNDLIVDLSIDLAQKAAKEAAKEKNYQALKAKVEKEYPVRQKLAKLLGRKLSDEPIHFLFVDVLIYKPELADDARKIIIEGFSK